MRGFVVSCPVDRFAWSASYGLVVMSVSLSRQYFGSCLLGDVVLTQGVGRHLRLQLRETFGREGSQLESPLPGVPNQVATGCLNGPSRKRVGKHLRQI